MRAKVPITISVSGNATGTQVISPMYIGSAKRPVFLNYQKNWRCTQVLHKSSKRVDDRRMIRALSKTYLESCSEKKDREKSFDWLWITTQRIVMTNKNFQE